MRVTSTGIENGHWQNKFGKHGDEFIDGEPALSVPFAIHNPPQGTKAYAVTLIDYDTVQRLGHPFIHWLVANLEYENVAEGESRADNAFIQGQNSRGENYYTGMNPPDKPHNYELEIYALDARLPLEDGFTHDELKKALSGHILESYKLSAMYRN